MMKKIEIFSKKGLTNKKSLLKYILALDAREC